MGSGRRRVVRDHDAGRVGHQDLREPDDADRPHARHRRQRRAVRHRRAGRDDRGCGGRGSGGSGERGDTAAPRATLVKLTGLKLRFHSSERATATATLRAGGKTIARGSAKAGTTTIRLRLTAAGRARLHRGHKLRATLTLTLRDASGNARKLTRKLTVRRVERFASPQ